MYYRRHLRHICAHIIHVITLCSQSISIINFILSVYLIFRNESWGGGKILHIIRFSRAGGNILHIILTTYKAELFERYTLHITGISITCSVFELSDN